MYEILAEMKKLRLYINSAKFFSAKVFFGQTNSAKLGRINPKIKLNFKFVHIYYCLYILLAQIIVLVTFSYLFPEYGPYMLDWIMVGFLDNGKGLDCVGYLIQHIECTRKD